MVAVILPVDASTRAHLDQGRDEFVVLDADVCAERCARRDLDYSIHRGTVDRAVIVNNLRIGKNEIERIAMSKRFALKRDARASGKLMNKNRDLVICTRRGRVSDDQTTK